MAEESTAVGDGVSTPCGQPSLSVGNDCDHVLNCSKCGEARPLSEFARKDRFSYRNYCKACRRKKRKTRDFDEDLLIVEVVHGIENKNLGAELFGLLKHNGFLNPDEDEAVNVAQLINRRNRVADILGREPELS